jgi:hypothetical protein
VVLRVRRATKGAKLQYKHRKSPSTGFLWNVSSLNDGKRRKAIISAESFWWLQILLVHPSLPFLKWPFLQSSYTAKKRQLLLQMFCVGSFLSKSRPHGLQVERVTRLCLEKPRSVSHWWRYAPVSTDKLPTLKLSTKWLENVYLVRPLLTARRSG